jgi:hypothetical protein
MFDSLGTPLGQEDHITVRLAYDCQASIGELDQLAHPSATPKTSQVLSGLRSARAKPRGN